MKQYIIGNISIDMAQLKDLKKSEFIKMFTGKSNMDLQKAWNLFDLHRKDYNRNNK